MARNYYTRPRSLNKRENETSSKGVQDWLNEINFVIILIRKDLTFKILHLRVQSFQSTDTYRYEYFGKRIYITIFLFLHTYTSIRMYSLKRKIDYHKKSFTSQPFRNVKFIVIVVVVAGMLFPRPYHTCCVLLSLLTSRLKLTEPLHF